MKRLQCYFALMRFNKPIGLLLLLWPTLIALWFAAEGIPDLNILLVFLLGVVSMRAAGCVINDIVDRKFDIKVARTNNRPIATGELFVWEASVISLLLLAASLWLVLQLNEFALKLSIIGVFLVIIYPFAKRITYYPQLVLSLAFGWGGPMSYAAIQQQLPLESYWLFLAIAFWIIAFDTQYAMMDREDDLKIGVKSTAIAFGQYGKIIIAILQFLMLTCLLAFGHIKQLTYSYFVGILCAFILFVYQYLLISEKKSKKYFKAFLNNNYVGLMIFIGIFLHYAHV